VLKELKHRMNEHILAEAADRYGVKPTDIRSIGGFESFVYEFEQNRNSYILKFNHDLRRTPENLMGEIDWEEYLASRGISVARHVPSIRRRLIEEIDDEQGGRFLVMGYEKALGRQPTSGDWTPVLFEQWGALLGKIHNITKSYSVGNSAWKRQEWTEEEQLKAVKYLPPSEEAVILRIKCMMEELDSLPKTIDTYGLVHSDIHQRNFSLESESITLFDFDDIGYHYFANDIGITLYYALNHPPKVADDLETYVHEFFHAFMRGYECHNHLDRGLLQYVPEFINLRSALDFVIYHQTSDPTKLDAHGLMLLDEHRRQVLHGMNTAHILTDILK